MEGTMAEIRMFAPNFAPRFWMLCNGQTLAINSNQALFALLGTTFGGNGQTNFQLPDFRGRSGIGTGSGFNLGLVTGVASTTLTAANVPPHNHSGVTGTATMLTQQLPGGVESPAGAYFAADGSSKFDNNHDAVTMAPATVALSAAAGGVSPVNNMMPYLAINYIICTQGIFPSRN